MYINLAARTHGFGSCTRRSLRLPSNQGQNSAGWCNQDASNLMTESTRPLTSQACRPDSSDGKFLADDAVMLAVPVPEHRRMAYRPGRWPRGRPTIRRSEHQPWTDTNGDGQSSSVPAVARVPQPDHECANLVVCGPRVQVLPSVWDTTSNFVRGNCSSGQACHGPRVT